MLLNVHAVELCATLWSRPAHIAAFVLARIRARVLDRKLSSGWERLFWIGYFPIQKSINYPDRRFLSSSLVSGILDGFHAGRSGGFVPCEAL